MCADEGRDEAGLVSEARRSIPLGVSNKSNMGDSREVQAKEEDFLEAIVADMKLGTGDNGVIIISLNWCRADVGEVSPLNRFIVFAVVGFTRVTTARIIMELKYSRKGREML